MEENEETYEVVKTSSTAGISGVLQILANKVSRKAAIVALAMVLVYLLAITPTVKSLVLVACIITGLAVFFTILQWILDKREKKVKLKILEREDKRKE